ncbi:pre-rRNA processing and 40S ribosomal subunit assembly, partial [Cryomyces antarcticus]
MAATLGKRKRDALNLGVERKHSTVDSGSEALQAIFRRAFEAKFKPLVGAPPPEHEIANELPKPEEEDEDSDWEGMESNNGEIVEVIEHSASDNLRDRATKEEMKAFM